MTDHGHELEVASAAVREACFLTRAVQDRVVASRARVLKADRSPVTRADLASQVVIGTRLDAAFPADPLMAEEDATSLDQSPSFGQAVLDLARSALPGLTANDVRYALDRARHPGGGSRFWVLDPIDGTKGFLRGAQYAIALALVEEAQVVVAVLGCPNLPLAGTAEAGPHGCLLTAVRGRGARQLALDGSSSHDIAVQPDMPAGAATACESVEAEHTSHERARRIAEAAGLTEPPLRMDSQCKYALVARGEVTIYLRLPKHDAWHETAWDHAAGALVVEEAGGRVSDLTGRRLDFGRRNLDVTGGILASNRHIHERVLAAARQVPR